MFISLKSNVIVKFSRVYSINQKNKNVINKTFNKFHKQEKMK